MRKSFLIVVALAVTFILVSGHAQQVTPPTSSAGMATNGSNATSGAAQNILAAGGTISANFATSGTGSFLGLSLTGTSGLGYINLPTQTSGLPPAPTIGINIYGYGPASFAFMGTAGHSLILSEINLTADHLLTAPNVDGTLITSGDTGTVTGTMLAASAVNLGGSTVTGTLPNTSVGATPLNAGTGATLVAPREYYVCTGACTVTPPVPAAGDEFCVYNDDNVATIITLAAIVGVQYETQARTSYKAADTSIASGGAIGDKMCIVGRDTTHYQVLSVTGTWN